MHCCVLPKSATVAKRAPRCDTGTAFFSQFRMLFQKVLWTTLRSGEPERSVTVALTKPGKAKAVADSAASCRAGRRFVFTFMMFPCGEWVVFDRQTERRRSCGMASICQCQAVSQSDFDQRLDIGLVRRNLAVDIREQARCTQPGRH